MNTQAIGVDLGGTKISAVVLGPENDVIWKSRLSTPSGDYEKTLQTIKALISDARTVCGANMPTRIGIGIPGALASDGLTIKNANSTCLIGKPLKADLEALLQLEVVMANDANCFALSEAIDGAGAGARVVFGVILGTGVGGGVALSGHIHSGPNLIAGEWGHNAFPLRADPPKHRACYCGKVDCIETWLSGPGLAQDYLDLTGEVVTAKELAARVRAGEAAAGAVLEAYSDNLAKGLSDVINLLDPDVIVLGGGVSNLTQLYTDVPKKLTGHIFNATDQPIDMQTRLVQNRWGDDSGVRGAAWLGRQV